jgi:hypothetical protein
LFIEKFFLSVSTYARAAAHLPEIGGATVSQGL